MSQIKYRRDASERFKSYIFVGYTDPNDMYSSVPSYENLEDWKQHLQDSEPIEQLFLIDFCLMIYYQEPEEVFLEYFGRELYDVMNDNSGGIDKIISSWLVSYDVPIFEGLDLTYYKIKEATYFENGEFKTIEFSDGSEIAVMEEENAFTAGYYVSQEKHSDLIEDLNVLKSLFNRKNIHL